MSTFLLSHPHALALCLAAITIGGPILILVIALIWENKDAGRFFDDLNTKI